MKIFYGIICDTVKLPGFGSGPKRGYILVFAVVQVIVLTTSGIVEFDSKYTLINMFFVASLCGAFMDCVIDGINCV